MTPPAATVSAVVFDLGGVLLDWDPRYLYRKLLPDDEVERFLEEIGFAEWNHAQDAGGTWAEAVSRLADRHPHRRALIEAYPQRFLESLSGPIAGTVELLEDLHRQGTRLLALTNWSAESFVLARREFALLDLFEGIVVSGEEGVAKPDARIFSILLDRFGLDPGEAVFVDDAERNVAAANDAGMHGVLFTGPDQLRRELTELGLLGAGRPTPSRGGAQP